MTRLGVASAALPELQCDDASLAAGGGAAPLDEATLRYIDAMRTPFDLLRQAAGQIAGVLVLAVSSQRSVAGHPMLGLAARARAEAADALRGAHPPPRGLHHHRHLMQAEEAIGAALDAARLHRRGGDDAATDAVLQPLRAGFAELQFAAGALPGFEVVAFAQGCCARHAAAAGVAPAPTNR